MSTEVIEESITSVDNVYNHIIILFNDNVNSFYHVADCLIKICKKTEEEALRITMEAHETGKSVCYNGSLEECETVGENLAEQGLTVSIQ